MSETKQKEKPMRIEAWCIVCGGYRWHTVKREENCSSKDCFEWHCLSCLKKGRRWSESGHATHGFIPDPNVRYN